MDERTTTNGHFPWPTNHDVERYVLGAVLIDDPEAEQVWDVLNLEDFSLRKHQMIYRRMRAVHHRGEPVDRVTVGTELHGHGELAAVDGLAYLVSLDTGLPIPAHSRRYIEILRELAQRRRAIQNSDCFIKNMADLTMDPETLLIEHRERLESIHGCADDEISTRGDVWSCDATLSYAVENLVLDGGITMFTGEPGAGKTLLLLAMAAAIAKGLPFAGMETQQRPVVYLERDGMPLALIRKHLFDMHIERLYPRLRILGDWEGSAAPGPTSRQLLVLAEREHAVFIFDSLIAFAQCDENDNQAVRAHLRQYRALCTAGGAVAINHHKSDKSNAAYRGASDHVGGIDLGWTLARDGESCTDNLSRVTLKPLKTRTGGRSGLRLGFEGGKFYPIDTPPQAPLDIIKDILRAYPGRNQKELKELASPKGLGKHTVEETVQAGVLGGDIEARAGKRKELRYYLPGQRLDADE